MKNSKGQSLIEVLIAFSVSIVIIAAAVLAILFALSNAQTSKNQNLATQYAQEGIEIVRQKSIAGDLPDNASPKCLNSLHELVDRHGVCPPISDSIPFLRQVTVRRGSGGDCGGAKMVIVEVFWSDNKCVDPDPNKRYCEKVELVSCLSESPTPAL